MLMHPRIGERVQLWYARRAAAHMPHHGRVGVVQLVARGPGPRNHGVVVGGVLLAVPAGNLRRCA